MKKNSKRMQAATDWSQFDAQTDAQIEAAIERDPDAAPIVDRKWFARARVVTPVPKEQISIRLDRDILDHLRSRPRYQTQINEILRAFVEHQISDKAGKQKRYPTAMMVAGYSGQRMGLAKQLGLGRRRAKNEEAPAPSAKPARAGRKR